MQLVWLGKRNRRNLPGIVIVNRFESGTFSAGEHWLMYDSKEFILIGVMLRGLSMGEVFSISVFILKLALKLSSGKLNCGMVGNGSSTGKWLLCSSSSPVRRHSSSPSSRIAKGRSVSSSLSSLSAALQQSVSSSQLQGRLFSSRSQRRQSAHSGSVSEQQSVVGPASEQQLPLCKLSESENVHLGPFSS